MNKLLAAQEAQLKAGNIAEKDYLRIQAIVISLQQDLASLNTSIADTENDLKTLLQDKSSQFIYPSEGFGSLTFSTSNNKELIDVAKLNNPYYQLQLTQNVYQQQNFTYQKSLKTPDITIGPEYDHNSNYTPHYVGLSVSLPLPLFNKNQGNIKSAGFAVKQQQAITQSAETELSNNISTAYNKLIILMQQNNNSQKEFYTKYSNMFNNILQSYKQKQINLLEFLDFFDAYKDAQLRLVQQQLNLHLAKEEVNFHAGIDIIKNN
jgi:cobalt-zinc-cadmium efflux system outer membrane protein